MAKIVVVTSGKGGVGKTTTSASFASGLALYIFTNTFLSAMHSIYMNKFDKQSLEIMATLGKPAVVATASKTDVKAAIAKASPAKKSVKSNDDGN